MKRYLPAIVVAALCAIVQWVSPSHIVRGEVGIVAAMLYSFTHANAWHFVANAVCLVQLRPRWYTCAVALGVAVAVGLCPFAAVTLPTCGLSGFLFACIARRYFLWRQSLWGIVLPNLLLALLPVFNWRVHLLSFFLAYGYYAFTTKPNQRLAR